MVKLFSNSLSKRFFYITKIPQKISYGILLLIVYLRRHFICDLILPDHFGMILFVGHYRIEHVTNFGRYEIKQVVIVSCRDVLFRSYDICTQKLIEVFACLIALMRSGRLVLYRARLSSLYSGHISLHQIVEHIVMILFVLQDFLEQLLELRVFRLRRVKVIFLHTELFLRFQFGN